jgi:hypothetical protein
MFVMVLPAESGEKVGFAVTIMLALSVFLTIVSESIPSNSISVSFLSVYLLIVQVISMLILMFTAKNMQIFHRNPDRFPVTPGYRRFVNAANKLRCQGRENSKSKSTSNQVEPISIVAEEQGNDKGEVDAPQKEDNDQDEVTWPDVTEAMDFVFLWLFFVFAVVATIVISVLMFIQPPLTETARDAIELVTMAETPYDDDY